ncbi:MAG: 30S ribosomal protein S17 [Elusimicrobia bacterium]|nr:30S ribosomal protein S17 [Elusimicrobiota bacterium]
MERTKRKLKTGIVTSDKSNKTRIVEVSRSFRHPFYDKVLKRDAKYYVHDEKNESHTGDQVKIAETRPLSKLKRWRLLEVIQKAK